MTIYVPVWLMVTLAVIASAGVVFVIGFAAALMSSNDYIDRLAAMTTEEFEQWKQSYRAMWRKTLDEPKEGERTCLK